MTTSNSSPSAPSPDFLLRLNAAAVAGLAVTLLVAVVLGYTCGLVTCLLAQRLRGGGSMVQPPDANATANQLVPMYEEVLPPVPTSIPLKENISYAQL